MCMFHIPQADYITREVKEAVEGSWRSKADPAEFCARFLETAVEQVHAPHEEAEAEDEGDGFAIGKLVRMHGLTSEKGMKWNGRFARVVPRKQQHTEGRIGVRMEDENTIIACRPENLAIAAAGK